MPRKKKTEETVNSTPDTVAVVPETLTTGELVIEEPVVEVPKEPETVKIRVKTGTLSFEMGTFEHGSIITVPKERVARFDPNSIEVIQ